LAHLVELLRRSRLMRYWAPVFIWMAGIFYFSCRPDPLDFLPSSGHGINIDRLAHITEYAGLAALLHRALRKQGSRGAREPGSKGAEEQGSQGEFSSAPPHPRTPALIALVYAILDELHQELVPGRGFQLADIGYDLAGIIVALGLIWVRETK